MLMRHVNGMNQTIMQVIKQQKYLLEKVQKLK